MGKINDTLYLSSGHISYDINVSTYEYLDRYNSDTDHESGISAGNVTTQNDSQPQRYNKKNM